MFLFLGYYRNLSSHKLSSHRMGSKETKSKSSNKGLGTKCIPIHSKQHNMSWWRYRFQHMLEMTPSTFSKDLAQTPPPQSPPKLISHYLTSSPPLNQLGFVFNFSLHQHRKHSRRFQPFGRTKTYTCHNPSPTNTSHLDLNFT